MINRRIVTLYAVLGTCGWGMNEGSEGDGVFDFEAGVGVEPRRNGEFGLNPFASEAATDSENGFDNGPEPAGEHDAIDAATLLVDSGIQKKSYLAQRGMLQKIRTRVPCDGRCEVGVRHDYAENESAFSKGLDNSWLPDQASAPAPASAPSTISSPASFSSSSTTSRVLRNRQSSSSPLSHKAKPSVSSTPSFSPNYIASTFSKKKKPIIPTIVIHPDEDDGGPPRALSQKDIECLSNMPPPPLRPLVQPWDDILEEDEYDDEMINEGRGHDDYHHQHHDSDNRRRSYDYDLESDEDYEVELDRMEGIDRNDIRAESFDPNALDVSIDLDVDLRELAYGDEVVSTVGLCNQHLSTV
ncbi:hypothetical protein BGZ58_003509 [Dissophora ornata]|nr:hypothetical protein BGZ58_003509 [Dissophora ornata]